MIETADHGGIAVLTLANGPVNALDLEVLTAVPEVLDSVADARAVVLTGAGRAFSAGVDLKRIVEGGPGYVERFLPALSSAVLALFGRPEPVVAAVNGHALAGGCVLAAACDVRLMSGGTIGLTELAAGVPFPTVPLEVMRHAVGPALDTMVLGAGGWTRPGRRDRPGARGRRARPAARSGAAARRGAVRGPAGRVRLLQAAAPRAGARTRPSRAGIGRSRGAEDVELRADAHDPARLPRLPAPVLNRLSR